MRVRDIHVGNGDDDMIVVEKKIEQLPEQIDNVECDFDFWDLEQANGPGEEVGYVDIDYGEIDGGGSFDIQAKYHADNKTLHFCKVITTGEYMNWTAEEILSEFGLTTK